MVTAAVILAGGQGERFWPKSRISVPKQFLKLASDSSMINDTINRITGMPGLDEVWVSTRAEYRTQVQAMIANRREVQIVSEPIPKNTAPGIGLVATHLSKMYGDAVMLVLPADHVISQTDQFRKLLEQARQLAKRGCIVTLGVMPDRPETGYGYIELGTPRELGAKVKRFVEKPELSTAEEYVRSGNYLWNSGIFAFRASRILKEIKHYVPELSKGLEQIAYHIGRPSYKQVLEETFASFPSISIDYGVMEKAENIVVLPADIGWDDVGSWLSVERLRGSDAAGNSFTGQVISHETHGVTVDSDGKRLIALAGIDDMVVVDCDDVLMICSKDAVKDMRTLVAKVRAEAGDKHI